MQLHLPKQSVFFFKMIFFSILNQLVLNCQMITSKMQIQFALFQKLSINFNFDWYWCQNNHQISRFELFFFSLIPDHEIQFNKIWILCIEKTSQENCKDFMHLSKCTLGKFFGRSITNVFVLLQRFSQLYLKPKNYRRNMMMTWH